MERRKKYKKNKRKQRLYMLLGLIVVAVIGITSSFLMNGQEKHKKGTSNTSTTKVGEVSFYTRSDMNKIPDLLSNKKYLAPTIDHDSLKKDIPNAKVVDSATGKTVPMDVWDSWPVTTPEGEIANFHGYRLVVGLTAKNGR